MKNEKVYLTFQTDRETSWLLKNMAHALGKTQPQFINELCQNYIKVLLEEIKKQNTEMKDV